MRNIVTDATQPAEKLSFGALCLGDLFKYHCGSGDIYMKIKDSHGESYALHLTDGKCVATTNTQPVERVAAVYIKTNL